MEHTLLSINQIKKPANAGWVAKAVVNTAGLMDIAPAEDHQAHDFDSVEIAWYGHDRLKITLRDAGPAQIRQTYLTGNGQNVILDLVRGPIPE